MLALVLLLALGAFAACGQESSELTEEEIASLEEIFGQSFAEGDLTDKTAEFMTKERQEKFKAVKKVYETPEGDFAFITKPIAYNGPIDLAVGVDSESNSTIGLKIVKHIETPHYVRDIENDWFTGRFAGKSTDSYLKSVYLEAEADNEVVTITGATVTTDGIINGVNAVMGVYQEAVLGQEAGAVDYMVAGFEGPEEEEAVKETGTLKIRAEGTVIGEINLNKIQELPSVNRRMVIQSSQGDTSHDFTGTLLSNVLDAVDPSLKEQYQYVEAVGIDEYLSAISMDEVKMENNVYLMYMDGGELLKTKDGNSGSMRIVVLDDTFGQRFTNYLIEISLSNES